MLGVNERIVRISASSWLRLPEIISTVVGSHESAVIRITGKFFLSYSVGIDAEEIFILFDTTGTVMNFESCVRTEWETTHLPVILIMADSWDPTIVDMSSGKRSQ